jgi:hypothetical protein
MKSIIISNVGYIGEGADMNNKLSLQSGGINQNEDL